MAPEPLFQALLFVLPALLIVAALFDLTSFTIPNWISVAGLVAYVAAALAFRLPLAEVGLSAAVAFAALLIGMGMFAAGWIGGGDAKLFAVAALWLGWPAALTYLVAMAIAGGVLSVVLLTIRQEWLALHAATGPAWLERLTRRDQAIPYGIAISVGALAAYPTSALFAAGLPGAV